MARMEKFMTSKGICLKIGFLKELGDMMGYERVLAEFGKTAGVYTGKTQMRKSKKCAEDFDNQMILKERTHKAIDAM